MKTRWLMILATIIAVLSLLVGITLAWFTGQAVVNMPLSTSAGTVLVSVEADYTDFDGISPGDEKKIKATIQNAGTTDIVVKLTDIDVKWNPENNNYEDLEAREIIDLALAQESKNDWKLVNGESEDLTDYIFYFTGGYISEEEEVELCLVASFKDASHVEVYEDIDIKLEGTVEAIQASYDVPEKIWDDYPGIDSKN